VIARWTGIPLGRLPRDSIASALSLEDRLRERVIGQDQALALVDGAMRNAAAQMSDPRKPPAVFLFVGTSGTGKTETALALADQFYGGAQHLSVINLSEFKEEHKISTLVGSPPGYVGFGEGGVLTEAVRRRPYGLLLLDEVDKAHPGVQDIFYQVFDKGLLRDGEGRDIEFRNTTIILTSNAGAETLAALAVDPETVPEGEALAELLRPELLRHFKPAFLGRVTVVPYLPLSEATLRGIVRLQLARLGERLRTVHKAILHVDEAVEDRIADRCLTGDIGARAVEGIIAREILTRISDLILDHAVRKAVVARIRLFVDGQNRFQVQASGVDAPSYRWSAAAGRDHARDHDNTVKIPAQSD
jgi:type VI secretion system protein VasG